MSAPTNRTWRFRSPRTFFGLSEEYMENVYEQFFFLKYAGGWSFSEAYNLPVGLRTWFTNRLSQQIEAENTAMEEASKPSGGTELTPYNAPDLPPHLMGQLGETE